MRPRTDLDEPIRLPPAPAAPPRAAFPLWAALVPVAGAVVLWQVTGSVLTLWFAALGPVVAVATLLDTGRARRRDRRRGRAAAAAALVRARAEVEHRQDLERDARWRATPRAAGYLADPDEVWRRVPGRGDLLVVGAGEAPSGVRVDADDERTETRELRRSAGVLAGAPVTVPVRAGIAIVGPQVAAEAAARALVAQLCLALPPGEARLVATPEEWMRRTPHAVATRGLRIWVGDAGVPVPEDAEVPIVRVGAGIAPPRCAAVLRLDAPDAGRLEIGGTTTAVRPEVLGREHAGAVADLVATRATAVAGAATSAVPFEALSDAPTGGLRVALGADRGSLVVVDLLDDGPHAVVIGVTGSGKSELLTTWVAALAERHGPSAVTFLLVDFKGGRAFDVLTPLPHVVGVVTDLVDDTTRRAIDSLGAEVRHRERVLGEHGARDVSELNGILPRLVIVVDEYAALTARHPEFHDMFADIAARGRALGMHLILASQRAAGFRDAVLANAPLRIALRVTDPADSRAVIGCIDAAALPGGVDDRGTALVRRAADVEPRPMRVSLCPPDAITGIADRSRSAEPAPVRRPWLPELPARIPLDAVRAEGTVVLGVADQPERQRQHVLLLEDDSPGLFVIGRAGSGRTTVLRTIARQVPVHRLRIVPSDLEEAWDAVDGLASAGPGDVIVVDDVDLLIGRFPLDHAAAVAETLERVAREARARGIRLVVSAQRLTAATGRIADQLPRRAVLATASRTDHVAFGGDGAHHDPRTPPGRGRLDGVLVQFADPGEGDARTGAPPTVRPWTPEQPTALVAPDGRATRSTLAVWEAAGLEVVPLGAGGIADPRGQASVLAPGRIVWGPPEAWVGRWRALAAGVDDALLVIDAACAADVRLLTGRRDLPPFAAPGRRRAWVFAGDQPPMRVELPSGPPEERPAADRGTPENRRLRRADARA